MEDVYDVINYPRNVCNVCYKPSSVVGNKMVICSDCKVRFHEKCYGLTTITSNSWICQACSLRIRPDCLLCPKTYGAMKPTECGEHWAHISCALWIPEVSFASVKYMEPIIKLSNILQERWGLKCKFCNKRSGACLQCQANNCWATFHVTCAFEHEMPMKVLRTIENPDGEVKLLSFCGKYCLDQKWNMSNKHE